MGMDGPHGWRKRDARLHLEKRLRLSKANKDPAIIISSVQRTEFGLEKEGLTKTFYSAPMEDAYWTALHVIQDKAAERVSTGILNHKYHEAMVKSDKPKTAIIKAIKEAEYRN